MSMGNFGKTQWLYFCVIFFCGPARHSNGIPLGPGQNDTALVHPLVVEAGDGNKAEESTTRMASAIGNTATSSPKEGDSSNTPYPFEHSDDSTCPLETTTHITPAPTTTLASTEVSVPTENATETPKENHLMEHPLAVPEQEHPPTDRQAREGRMQETHGNNNGKPGKVYVKTELKPSNVGLNIDCNERRGPLMPIFKNSKYYADKKGRYNFTEAKAICEENMLVLAEMDNVIDHRSLELFFNYNINPKMFNPEYDRFYIGMNDLSKEGAYKRGDGKPLQFQNYHTSQPDDKNMKEDCTSLGKEFRDGPVGASDEDCSKGFRVICQATWESECFIGSVEYLQGKKAPKKGLDLITEIVPRTYYVSNFPDSWANALQFCLNNSMTLFDMDSVVTYEFFYKIDKWESSFINAPSIPPPQYWTAGKFRETHMNAEVFWHTEKRKHTVIDEWKGGKNFSFSGIFRWSTRKLTDPGGPYDNRKDLCLSFAFEMKPDPTPFIRNTNCNLPCFFVCRKETGDAELKTFLSKTHEIKVAPAKRKDPKDPQAFDGDEEGEWKDPDEAAQDDENTRLSEERRKRTEDTNVDKHHEVEPEIMEKDEKEVFHTGHANPT